MIDNIDNIDKKEKELKCNEKSDRDFIINRESEEYSKDYLNYSCYFYEDKVLFGSYPTQKQTEILQEQGVKIFVDLTEKCENLPNYETKFLKIKYEIRDRKTPENYKVFLGFIIYLSSLIKNLKKDKMYIHCKGGHGRSGLVAACLLSYMNKIPPYKALELTRESHDKRKIMRECWRNIGAPQTRDQHNFVKKVCGFFYFSKAYPYGRTAGLSIFSDHPVDIENLGRFPTTEAAYQAFRNPSDKEYVERQKNSINAYRSRIMGENYKNTKKEWDEEKDVILLNVITIKINQYYIIRNNLENTFLKHIIFKNKDTELGCDDNYDGENRLGKILMKIKEDLLLKRYLNNC